MQLRNLMKLNNYDSLDIIKNSMKYFINPKMFLSNPSFYKLFQNLVGYRKSCNIYVNTYVRAQNGFKILDIGCGPCDILEYLPDVYYVGFDMNQQYIDSAKRRFGDQGTFICSRIDRKSIKKQPVFDLVMANGVLHHLDDLVARELFVLAREALKPGGRLITIDGCYVKEQSKMAHYILSRDRGKFVRSREAYLNLASSAFKNNKVTVRHDLLSIPYTHIIIECVRDKVA